MLKKFLRKLKLRMIIKLLLGSLPLNLMLIKSLYNLMVNDDCGPFIIYNFWKFYSSECDFTSNVSYSCQPSQKLTGPLEFWYSEIENLCICMTYKHIYTNWKNIYNKLNILLVLIRFYLLLLMVRFSNPVLNPLVPNTSKTTRQAGSLSIKHRSDSGHPYVKVIWHLP